MKTLITGGTCAAMRILGIMHTMGFRKFHLFGFDSSLKDEPTKEQRKETTGAEDEEPKPKYLQVTVRGENYWTTGELLAMAQDCEKVFSDEGLEELNYSTMDDDNSKITSLGIQLEMFNRNAEIFRVIVCPDLLTDNDIFMKVIMGMGDVFKENFPHLIRIN